MTSTIFKIIAIGIYIFVIDILIYKYTIYQNLKKSIKEED